MSVHDTLTTDQLLQIIEPHREALREMGWTVVDYDNPHNVGITNTHNGRTEVLYADLAARILCDVVMERLEKWALNRKPQTIVRCGQYDDGQCFASVNEHDYPLLIERTVCHAPTRLAALLQLHAWTGGGR